MASEQPMAVLKINLSRRRKALANRHIRMNNEMVLGWCEKYFIPFLCMSFFLGLTYSFEDS